MTWEATGEFSAETNVCFNGLSLAAMLGREYRGKGRSKKPKLGCHPKKLGKRKQWLGWLVKVRVMRSGKTLD